MIPEKIVGRFLFCGGGRSQLEFFSHVRKYRNTFSETKGVLNNRRFYSTCFCTLFVAPPKLYKSSILGEIITHFIARVPNISCMHLKTIKDNSGKWDPCVNSIRRRQFTSHQKIHTFRLLRPNTPIYLAKSASRRGRQAPSILASALYSFPFTIISRSASRVVLVVKNVDDFFDRVFGRG